MSMVNAVVADLRERRLWPVALVLGLAILAVPFVLAKHAPAAPAPAPSAASAPAGGLAQTATAAPSVTVDAALQHSKLTGPARDPFQQGSAAKLAVNGTASAITAGSGAAASGAATSAGASTPTGSSSTPAAGTSGAGSTPAPAPSQSIPATHRPPAPTGLRPDQSYSVQLAITRPDGGISTVGALERLSVVPSRQNPLLVELGVLQGARRVLFAVMPDARINGPGRCIPGPIDCELISLAPNQVESVAAASGVDTTFAQFAVTGISATTHGSVAAANAARRRAYDGGARLLDTSQLNALSLFQYEPGVGAVVDLRNLSGGGN